MQTSGHFINKYVTGSVLLRKLYSSIHMILILFQFACIMINMGQNTMEVTELTCEIYFKYDVNLVH